VLLIASPLGTPTNSAIWHYMNQNEVPQLFVSTGAIKWDDPKHRQPNYQSEGRVYASYILEHNSAASPSARICRQAGSLST